MQTPQANSPDRALDLVRLTDDPVLLVRFELALQLSQIIRHHLREQLHSPEQNRLAHHVGIVR